MAGVLGNIQVEPCKVLWDGADMGFTDGDIEVSPEEQGVEITAHQEGTNVLDMIRTGKKVEVTLTLKETTPAKVAAMLAVGGGSKVGVAQIVNVTCGADTSGSLNNKFFFVYDADGVGYCVWLNVNSAGVDPSIPGFTSVPVALATGATANAVADAVAAALDALDAFVAPNPGAAIVAITNADEGAASSPDAGNSGFTVAIGTAGVDELTGWGKSKDFTGMLGDSAELVLHPVTKDDADESADLVFWKAYPMVGSIVKSGENPNTVAVTFKIFPDMSQPDEVRLFGIGAHS